MQQIEAIAQELNKTDQIFWHGNEQVMELNKYLWLKCVIILISILVTNLAICGWREWISSTAREDIEVWNNAATFQIGKLWNGIDAV